MLYKLRLNIVRTAVSSISVWFGHCGIVRPRVGREIPWCKSHGADPSRGNLSTGGLNKIKKLGMENKEDLDLWGNMDDEMDCTSSLLANHQRPECIDSSTEPKRQKLDDIADEKLIENANRTERLTQLKKDIAILETAIRRGQQTMEKMLNIAVEDMTIDPLSRQDDLLKRRRSLMAELISTQGATAKKNRVERLQNGSLIVNLLEHIGKDNDNPFIKVEAWELKKCGCDFCVLFRSRKLCYFEISVGCLVYIAI
ncbi:NAD-specific glutamate dehydrogenase [Dirofilaria immitis]